MAFAAISAHCVIIEIIRASLEVGDRFLLKSAFGNDVEIIAVLPLN